jgi:hypothetical protein
MYSRFGLQVVSMWSDYATTLVTVRKPVDTIVPRLEQALHQAATAIDDQTLEEATRAIAALGRDVAENLALLAPILRSTPEGSRRYEIVQQIRRMVRG